MIKKNYLALVLARKGSRRLKNKNVLKLGSKPLISWTLDNLKKISNLSVHIKSEKGDYGPVEDIQLIINHILAHWFQKNL